jgi:type IV pilus assembly protein PilM
MSIFSKIRNLVSEPPPDYVFELSEAGIAWARPADSALHFAPLEAGTLEVTPLADNIKEPGRLTSALRGIATDASPARRKRAALLLPDYAARVAVLDFDTFPSNPEEQKQLARFRAKRAVPFDIDSAMVACYAQPRHDGSKRVDVVVTVINMEVAAHYEAPFRAAGLHCGVITVSALAALALAPASEPLEASPSIVAKFSGRVLALSLLDGVTLRMFRCLELSGDTLEEAADVMATTFAYAEDELGARPRVVRVCGLERTAGELRERWADELGVPVTGLTSRFGTPAARDAGLAGYLETWGGR